MNDELYKKLRRRVENQLAKAPRYATINALLFSIFAIMIALFTLDAVIDGSYDLFFDGLSFITMPVILGWAALSILYAGTLFVQSGAWTRRRESVIEAEISEIRHRYDFDEEDWADLRLSLSRNISDRSRPFRRLMVHSLINGLLWIGVQGSILTLWYFFDFAAYDLMMIVLMVLSALTAVMIFTLPFKSIFHRPERNAAQRRALYSHKAKRRKATRKVDYPRLALTGDDSELIFNDGLDDSLSAAQGK